MLAVAFYLTGDIEKYGSGFRRIREYIEEYPTMKTEFKEIPNGLLFTYSYVVQKNSITAPFYTPEMNTATNDIVVEKETHQEREQEREQESNENIKKLLHVLDYQAVSVSDLMVRLRLNARRNFLYTYLYPAIEAGYISMTYPDNPKHRNQRYHLTQKGKEIKEKILQ